MMPLDRNGEPVYSNHPRRCLPCLHAQSTRKPHVDCWASVTNIEPEMLRMYWCECPCGTGELQARRDLFLEKDSREFPNKDH